MPNWCYNSISVYHDDPAMIQKMIDGADKGELFNTFVTMPEALRTTTSPADFEKNHALVEKYGHADWYSWSLANWGTKWDVSLDNVDTTDEGRTLHATFDSAWAPPTAFYDALVKLGFKVDATYTEEGMGFAGHYLNGDDESIDLEFDENSKEWIDEIGNSVLRELVECEYENWLSWQEEEKEEPEGD